MAASQSFAETYAAELRYRTNAKVSFYGPHSIEQQGIGRAMPANTIRIKSKVNEITLTFGEEDVTISGTDGDGVGYAQPGFKYADGDLYEKLEKALVARGLHFVRTRHQWARRKEAG